MNNNGAEMLNLTASRAAQFIVDSSGPDYVNDKFTVMSMLPVYEGAHVFFPLAGTCVTCTDDIEMLYSTCSESI
jgi:hypothetical protein